MHIDLEIQFITTEQILPHPSQLKEWVAACYSILDYDVELCIRVVDLDEMRDLNYAYRGKKKPTNVLSFPNNTQNEFQFEDGSVTLGDIIICAPYVATEAEKLKLPLMEHWAHLIIHGCLHLLGYTHDNPATAFKMEVLETKILTALGFQPPYND